MVNLFSFSDFYLHNSTFIFRILLSSSKTQFSSLTKYSFILKNFLCNFLFMFNNFILIVNKFVFIFNKFIFISKIALKTEIFNAIELNIIPHQRWMQPGYLQKNGRYFLNIRLSNFCIVWNIDSCLVLTFQSKLKYLDKFKE